MNNIGRFSVIVLLIFLSTGVFFAQSSEHGSEHRALSTQLYNFFLQEGFQPQRQFLTNSNQFPYTILLEFNQQRFVEDQDIQRFIIAVSQETARDSLDELLSLAKKMNTLTGNVRFTLALLANENAPLPPSQEHPLHPTGSQILLDNISNPEACALVLLDGSSLQFDQETVVFGTDGILTPLWLIQQVPLPITHDFLITYRLNLAEDNPVLIPFFRSGMATVAVSFDSAQVEQRTNVFSAMETMLENFSIEKSVSANSQNYIVFHFVENIWIGEQFSILVYLFITILVLAIISGFSFLGKKGAIHRQSFFKIWYLIPLTILLSTFFLYLGQLVAGKIVDLVPQNTMIILGIKTLFSFIAVSLPFLLHLKLRLPIVQFAYGYLLTVVVAMNIFIFASIDLVLLFIFVLEYIIIYFSRIAGKVFSLLVASLIMLLPFIPYALNLLEYASQDKLLQLVETGIIGNMLYACILIPFQVMWLRIMVRIDLFGSHRHISSFKIVLSILAIMGIMIVSVMTTLFLGSFILYRTIPGKKLTEQTLPPYQYQIVAAKAPEKLQVSVARKSYLELQSVEVYIDSPVPVVRYEVSVTSENQIPVYDSPISFVTVQNTSQNENHSKTEGATATTHFLIPDFPTNTTSFEYTADGDISQNIKILLYLQVAPQQVCLVERNFFLPALEGIR